MYYDYLETNIPYCQKILAIATDIGVCDIILPIQENYTNPPAMALLHG